MKNYLSLIFIAACLLILSGCDDLNRLIKGEDYVASSQSASASRSAESRYQKDLDKALKSDSTAFPQLSKKIASDEAQVVLQTSMGDITIKLFPTYAPLAVENFLTHAKSGYYDGLTFHRVIDDFVIQGGDPSGNGSGGESIWKGKDSSIDSGKGFANEISPYLYHLRGALAMANSGADTNTSQFFIVDNSEDQSASLSENQYPQAIIDAYKEGGYPSLDGNYTVFGQVTDGMTVVDKIAQTPTDDNDKPQTDVTITAIKIIKDYSFKK
ncbi:peptidylprolyl isomerase [Streptococcus sp. H31]|uniref:peptidylprolyl isomerase n=1 Tax=Streptococcus huangxiaojuni TaxID=3237239 RepID=UPI0034A26CE8